MKMLEYIKEYEKILIIILMLLMISGIILNTPITQTDESTLFFETLKMYNGKLIYKDVNVLVTPLFFYMGLFIFNIFAPTYLVYRIFGIAIYLFLLYNIYSLLKELKVKNIIIFITIPILILFLRKIMKYGANYNILAIAISILAIKVYIKKQNKNNRFYIIQGILIFLVFMTKQTIGVYYALVLVILEFDYKNIINVIKKIAILALPSIIGVIIYGIYLYFTKSLYNFIDYTFLGMLEFQQNANMENGIILLSLVNIIPVITLILTKKADKNQEILFICSIIMLLIAYPILCDFHSRMALIYSIISYVYLLNTLYKENKGLKCLIIIAIIVISMYNVIHSLINVVSWNKNKIKDIKTPYYGATYDKDMNAVIRYITDYIEKSEENIVFISPQSILYNIEMNRTNGILDLPLKGNVRKKWRRKNNK